METVSSWRRSKSENLKKSALINIFCVIYFKGPKIQAMAKGQKELFKLHDTTWGALVEVDYP